MTSTTTRPTRRASGDAVLVIGSANMDLVVACDRFPEPGETRFADSFATYSGGKGANQAVAAAKLGGEVFFLGRIGADGFGDELTARLSKSGLRTDNLLRDEAAPTGVALITVDANGQNEILIASGSNSKLTPEDVAAHAHLFDRSSVVLLQLESPLPAISKAVEMATQHGLVVVLNPAPATDLPDELLQHVDFLTPNESEAEALSGLPVRDATTAEAAARRLLDRGVRNVVVTLGAEGAILVSQDMTLPQTAPVVSAVDTTAAGDAFNGALARALSWKWKVPDALQFAVFTASFTVMRAGAQPSLPSLFELEKFIPANLFRRVPRTLRESQLPPV